MTVSNSLCCLLLPGSLRQRLFWLHQMVIVQLHYKHRFLKNSPEKLRFAGSLGQNVAMVAWLSKYEAPNFQQVSDVLTVLIGVWSSQDGNIVVSALIEKARELSPTLIRPLVADDAVQQALTDEFKNALAAIDNFSYSIVKGFFVWDFSFPNGSTQQGIFAQDCLSDSFKKFQARVVKLQPTTFEEIEEELL